MKIICPKCEFQQDVPDEKIPPRAETATCPQCHEKFRFRTVDQEDFLLEEKDQSGDSTRSPSGEAEQDYSGSMDHARKDEDSIWSSLENMGTRDESGHGSYQSHDAPEEGYEVPWENLDKTGYFPGFMETVKRVMLAPAAFFYKMPLKGLFMPLAFFLLVMVVQALATFIWHMAGIVPATSEHGSGLGMGMMGAGSLFIVIIYPLFMGLWLFVASGITHLFLTLFQAGKSGLEGTFRATAYGSAPMILGLLPFLGPIIGAVWSFVVTVVGYKNIHETSFPRVILAMLAPVLVIVVIAALMY